MQKQLPVRKPGKQRKMLFKAPLHIRQKHMSAHLSPELRNSKGVKSLPVRKGDTVQIARGDNIGFEGKINRVDLKKYRIYIEGLTREKVDGTNIFISVHPSKVVIKKLKLDDKWRKAIIERKKAIKTVEEKKETEETKKPVKKTLNKTKKSESLAAKTKQKRKKPNKKIDSLQKDTITNNKKIDSKKSKKNPKKAK